MAHLDVTARRTYRLTMDEREVFEHLSTLYHPAAHNTPEMLDVAMYVLRRMDAADFDPEEWVTLPSGGRARMRNVISVLHLDRLHEKRRQHPHRCA